jgi:transposase
LRCLTTAAAFVGSRALTRKKTVLHAQERDSAEVRRKRQELRDEMAGIDPRRLVFVDESGANTAMTRTRGRAPVGERVHGSVPGGWQTVTLICGLRSSGATTPTVFPGATDTATFESYVEQVLVPDLRHGDVVVWDNLQPHKAAAVVAAIEAAGARVVPLPASSPDMTPIEEMFTKVKEALRAAAADDGGRLCSDRYGLAGSFSRRHRGMVLIPRRVLYPIVRRSGPVERGC